MKNLNKILIIGQAPPSQTQQIPYDTTMLYEIFEWIGIDKKQALNLFDFDAVYNKFPGFDGLGNHLAPNIKQMTEYWDESLSHKINNYDKIIILGSVAKSFLSEKIFGCKILYLLHPSRRNFQRILQNKEYITNQLKQFIYEQKI